MNGYADRPNLAIVQYFISFEEIQHKLERIPLSTNKFTYHLNNKKLMDDRIALFLENATFVIGITYEAYYLRLDLSNDLLPNVWLHTW
jgi:hypothetical protein